jgi:DNA-binding MarR family transcriptional regulator
MVNPKSVDSYHKLLEEGTISKRQSEVYYVLLTLGKATNRQIAKSLNWDINRVTGRVKELRDKNLVTQAGESYDSMTNRTVNLWEINSQPNSQLADLFNQFKNIFNK